MKGILFVDRNDDLLVTMKVFFEKEGFFCFATSSYEQAIQSLSTVIPDLILLDFTDKDKGYAMISKLRENAAYRGIPIVITLDKSQPLTLPERAHLPHIEKPFNLPELSSLLRSIT